MRPRSILYILIIALLTHCTNHDRKEQSNKWYLETKTEILKQSNLNADSTSQTFNEDKSYLTEDYYSFGHKFLTKGYNNTIPRLEIHYSKDGNFELRRELCDNGNLGFEGITYKEHFYGLSTWRRCNGTLDQKGVRFNDQKIGIWKEKALWGQYKNTDYGNYNKFDSMPTIKNYR